MYFVVVGYEPPSLSKKKMYVITIFYYIAAPRARLIKNLFSPTRCPEKEKSASENSRAFQYIVFLQGELYFDTRRRNALAALRSRGFSREPLSSYP
jgi:hypothetical protein